jgi:hypothetical protein
MRANSQHIAAQIKAAQFAPTGHSAHPQKAPRLR